MGLCFQHIGQVTHCGEWPAVKKRGQNLYDRDKINLLHWILHHQTLVLLPNPDYDAWIRFPLVSGDESPLAVLLCVDEGHQHVGWSCSYNLV